MAVRPKRRKAPTKKLGNSMMSKSEKRGAIKRMKTAPIKPKKKPKKGGY